MPALFCGFSCLVFARRRVLYGKAGIRLELARKNGGFVRAG